MPQEFKVLLMPSPTSSISNLGLVSIAVDFGGTKTAAARVVQNKIVERKQISTDRRASPDQQFVTIVGLIDSLKEANEKISIGVAVCGRVDRGDLWHAINHVTLKDFEAYPLRSKLEAHFQCPVRVMNDGVAASWGEYLCRASEEDILTLLYVTVSTGVGGGIVLNGQPLISVNGLAGHIGFMRSPFALERCGSGRFGTLESIASGNAIGRMASAGRDNSLTGRDVFEAHLANDEDATGFVDTSAQAVATAIADVRSLLDIDFAVIGGSVGLAKGYVARVQEHLDNEPQIFRPRLSPAKLGPDSALFGVATQVPAKPHSKPSIRHQRWSRAGRVEQVSDEAQSGYSVGTSESTNMYAEAREASTVVATQLRENAELVNRIGQVLHRRPPKLVVTCARGSSDHAATYAKYLIETSAGVPVSSAAPSVSSVYLANQAMRDTVFLALSQSGESPDLLAAAKAAKKGGALVIALVNVAHSPLAALADEVLPLHAGPETSVAATKSYIATLVALAHLVASWTDNPELSRALSILPEQLNDAWHLDWSEAIEALRYASNFFVIGRGMGLGIAQEAALKFKETAGLHAEAYSAAEVRHGPMAIVGAKFPVLMFVQRDETRSGFDAIVEDFTERGANVMVAGNTYEQTINLPWIEGAAAATAPILLIQSFYRMVNALAVVRGYDPDRPPHLRKVTETV